MSSLDQFIVRFADLKPGLHAFSFEIEDAFFQEFEGSLVERGSGLCKLELDKKTNLLSLDFDLEVSVELVCDRSLKKFDHPMKIDRQLIVKFGEEDGEMDDDIMVIGWDARELNVAHIIYEYVTVAIPMKRIHPDHLGENEDEFGEIIYKSEDKDSGEGNDPRWNALKNLN